MPSHSCQPRYRCRVLQCAASPLTPNTQVLNGKHGLAHPQSLHLTNNVPQCAQTDRQPALLISQQRHPPSLLRPRPVRARNPKPSPTHRPSAPLVASFATIGELPLHARAAQQNNAYFVVIVTDDDRSFSYSAMLMI